MVSKSLFDSIFGGGHDHTATMAELLFLSTVAGFQSNMEDIKIYNTALQSGGTGETLHHHTVFLTIWSFASLLQLPLQDIISISF